MSHYKYTIRDYHAIELANIMLDGITVVSGENGCGKSTLSRWLYYLVNGASRFDFFLYQDFISSLQREFNYLGAVYQDLRMTMASTPSSLIYDGKRRLEELMASDSEDNLHQAMIVYHNTLDRFGVVLSDYLKGNYPKASKDRALKFLGIDRGSSLPAHQRVSDFIIRQKKSGEESQKRYLEAKDRRSQSEFFSQLKFHYDIREEIPEGKIELEEDKVSLLKNRKVGYLYNLRRAIYVNTPMAVSEDMAVDNVFWEDLQKMMIYPVKGRERTKGEKKLIIRLQKLIKGSVTAEKDDFDQLELRYKREDGLDIKLDDVATGMKTFSYILRLIENGYLDDQTLLLIDEPEAHLHPQWVVEFAHILVLLNKELGVKVMVASHHPNMVAAIQAISEKEGVKDTTIFYIALSSDKPYKYVYGELGNNVEEIFRSFNFAYDKISQYGV
ncbi:MAG: ATP-binding protein [Muribaculaceae bacterium]|nr:ATP-binding protein [Muribaculaceae bacterium]